MNSTENQLIDGGPYILNSINLYRWKTKQRKYPPKDWVINRFYPDFPESFQNSICKYSVNNQQF